MTYSVLAVAFCFISDALPKEYNKVISSIIFILVAGVFILETRRTIQNITVPQYPWQAEMYMAGREVGKYIPKGESVGSFNSGIIGYVSGIGVVNLDGVVNEDAARSIRRYKLGEYLKSRGINYIVDYPVMWSYSDFLHSTGPYFRSDLQHIPIDAIKLFDIQGIGWPSSDQGIVLGKINWN